MGAHALVELTNLLAGPVAVIALLVVLRMPLPEFLSLSQHIQYPDLQSDFAFRLGAEGPRGSAPETPYE